MLRQEVLSKTRILLPLLTLQVFREVWMDLHRELNFPFFTVQVKVSSLLCEDLQIFVVAVLEWLTILWPVSTERFTLKCFEVQHSPCLLKCLIVFSREPRGRSRLGRPQYRCLPGEPAYITAITWLLISLTMPVWFARHSAVLLKEECL